MFEFLPLVLTLVLADLYPFGFEPVFFDPWLTAAGALALPLLAGGLARSRFRAAETRLMGHGDGARFVAECQRAGLAGRIVLLLGYVALVFLLHWPYFAGQVLGLSCIPLFDRTAVIAPALAGLFALWIAGYPLDRRLRRSTWTLGEYLDFRARASLGTILLPILFMSSAIDALMRMPAIERSIAAWPSLEWAVVAAVVLALYTFAPLALRSVWRAEPLPAGPLRDRLEEVRRRAGFRCRDLLVWRSGGGRIANALVIGLVGPLRYVVFTDALLEQLSEEEVASVLGHEIGHVKHHHLPLYFGFSLSLILFLVWVDFAVGPWLSPARLGTWGSEAAGGALLIAVLGSVFFLFGFVSRRFERQADLHGAALTADPIGFAGALEKIAALNGMPRAAGSWRYFSIEQRVHDVLAAAASPQVHDRMQASARHVALGLVAFYVLSLGGALQAAAEGNGEKRDRLRRYRALEFARRAEEHFEEGKLDLARAEIEAALVEHDDRAVYLVLYGEILRGLGERDAARAAYRQARALGPSGLWERLRIQRGLTE